MRRPLVLLVLLGFFLPAACRALLPFVHGPCEGLDPSRTSECPACVAISHSAAAILPVPAELPGATFVGIPAVDALHSPPSLQDRQPPPTRGPPPD